MSHRKIITIKDVSSDEWGQRTENTLATITQQENGTWNYEHVDGYSSDGGYSSAHEALKTVMYLIEQKNIIEQKSSNSSLQYIGCANCGEDMTPRKCLYCGASV